MADSICWCATDLPIDIVKTLVEDFNKFDNQKEISSIDKGTIDTNVRNSKNVWIPTTHWSAGWIWYYVQKINRENFEYDLIDIDGGSMQYTHYDVGEFYNWHSDGNLNSYPKPDIEYFSGSNNNIKKTQFARKLSFVLQLSDPKDYLGGELQFLLDNSDIQYAPKQQGTLILFDSRIQHRVRKIKSGYRKSLVGWVIGPKWK
ncbi:2OG-Fe(II) oxygenase [archaeon]|nr:2OG-Fe(II) oxygenase [archaeon]